jgi:hypothetical protein
MVIISLFSWWYTTGWMALIQKGSRRVESVLKFFSVPLLLTSLFAPFRQISAGRVNGPLGAQLRAWGDRLFSRFIGAFVRSFLIIIGLLIVSLVSAMVLIAALLWPLLPAAPIIGLLLIGGGK